MPRNMEAETLNRFTEIQFQFSRLKFLLTLGQFIFVINFLRASQFHPFITVKLHCIAGGLFTTSHSGKQLVSCRLICVALGHM